ncbi:MAG TPA: glycosyl hydrolase, partial [Clostridiales bacterium]|nr:glycosyl hydrolase [Clostridiales bacterium]
MKEKIHLGLIGLGGRGYGLLTILVRMDNIEIAAISDNYEDRRLNAIKEIEAVTGKIPYSTCDYKDIIYMKDIDAVIISTSWADHTNMAIDAMKAGKYVATEVGGAYSIDECWQLVKTHEQTGIPCMMLENCCYGREELM